MDITRRAPLAGLVGLAGLSALPMGSRAQPAGGIPREGIGNKIKFLSYSDQGGRPEGVQVMVNKGHVYVGHLFGMGFTTLDARDPRNVKPVHFTSAGPNTRSHHLQSFGDYLLVVMGVDTQPKSMSPLTPPKPSSDPATHFRAGLAIYDIANPASPREIAFLPTEGFGVNRLWWTGGRYAYVSAHFWGYTDDILCIVDLQEITKPKIVSKWWLPGMWAAGGEKSREPKGKRFALHHMLVAGNYGYGAWRDGGFTILDVSDPAHPKLVSYMNWSPPFQGGTHSPLPLPGRKLCLVADESNAYDCANGTFRTWVIDVEVPKNPVPISTLPSPTGMDFCKMGNVGPHNLHENRPDAFVSETTIFATYHDAGVRVFDTSDQFQPREIASWVPPIPTAVNPHGLKGAMTCDCYVTREGLMFVSDWNAGLNVLQYEG